MGGSEGLETTFFKVDVVQGVGAIVVKVDVFQISMTLPPAGRKTCNDLQSSSFRSENKNTNEKFLCNCSLA